MQWLAPTTALVAAAATIPPLVAMYFLKLKRREQLVSSTLLWKRAVRDLQVNAPFQRLRRNLLLLIQLLVFTAVLAALARPMLSLAAGPGRRYVLLIDRSASMSATDGGVTRLERAKERARVLIESLRGRTAFGLQDSSDQAMIVAFSGRAQVMCNFTSDKRQLLAALDAISPTDGGSSVADAIAVARAFAQSPGERGDERSAEAAAQLELFSDGRIADLAEVSLRPGELNFHRVGHGRDNVSVAAMQARRSYEKPEQAEVFVTIANFGEAEAACDVQLSVNGNVRAVRSVTVPPMKQRADGGAASAGKVSVTFALKHTGAGVVEVRQLRADMLACDDAAWAVLDPPRRLSVLLVSAGNPVLASAMKACPLARLDVLTPGEFDAMDESVMTVERRYDVVVLDGHSPANLPAGRYLVFGRPVPDSGVATAGVGRDQVVVDFHPRHPVLRHVNLSRLFASKCWKMSLPREAEVLAEFGDCPALAIVRTEGRVFLLAGFDVMQTNWPFESGFVMFCYNAMSFLGLEVVQGAGAHLRVGEPVIAEGLPPGANVVLSGPGFSGRNLEADASGTFRYPGTDRAGVYGLAVGERPARHFAVNLLDPRESDILPAERIVLSGREVAAQQSPPQPANVEIWPILAMLALSLVCLEWFVYNSRVRL